MNVLEKIFEELEERGNIQFSSYSKPLIAVEDVLKIIRSHMDDEDNDGWIPVEERLPEDDRCILLSFENFSLPLVGRYEENEKGGAFYIGDCDEEDTCASNDLFVNAWKPLPEPYRPKEKDDE